MKKIFNAARVLALVLIVAASCIAVHLKNQRNGVSCSEAVCYMTICPNRVYGNITFIEPYINDCDTVLINMHMNLSDVTDTHYFHHYRGDITTDCGANDVANYTIIGHVYFSRKHFNGTASMCNDDCSDLFFDGDYELYGRNATCHQILTQALIC